MTGTSVNAVEIVDNEFGIVAHNSYRLKRKVEMYQWQETIVKEGKKTKHKYS